MARYLVRFGYDGLGFAGWARQPGLRTVEGEIRDGLVRLGVAPTADASELSVASRTDRGVSARGNALALTTGLSAASTLRALNGIAPEIVFTNLSPVPEGFRPRAASGRWYRYWEHEASRVPEGWTEVGEIFSGRIDVRSFGRGLPSVEPTWREIESVSATVDGGWLVVDVRARSFVWGMVRKMISAFRDVEAGRLTPTALRAALRGERRLSLPLAEPDRLVLWETFYPIRWLLDRYRLTARQERHLHSATLRAAARAVILSRTWSEAGRAGPEAEPVRPDPVGSRLAASARPDGTRGQTREPRRSRHRRDRR